MYSATIRSALMSFKEKASPFIKPRNFVGRPRYSMSPRESVKGKENSGKKSPAVMILPFSPAHAGAKDKTRKRKEIPRMIHRFIYPAPLEECFRTSIRNYRDLSTGFKSC
jgi:hypothetical protein